MNLDLWMLNSVKKVKHWIAECYSEDEANNTEPNRQRHELGSEPGRFQGLHLPVCYQFTWFPVPDNINKSNPTHQHNFCVTYQKHRYSSHHVLPDLLLSHRALLATSCRLVICFTGTKTLYIYVLFWNKWTTFCKQYD